nr:hypothetical protein [Kibdelosporangium sp. MJ126-NF4]CEL13516.1 hypothetical protein [Kibdelosporangium sp. MJ126-NF4]CTQ99201.1 hypothetical protein [Kibdelosporangium sp. MJ126-NF4]
MVDADFFVVDLSALGKLNDKISDLLRDGWQIRDSVGDIRLTRVSVDVHADINRINEIDPRIVELEVVGTISGEYLRLRTVQGKLEVVGTPNSDPSTLFEGDEVDNAHLAREGDVVAALLLPLEWVITAFLEPEASIDGLPENIEIVVATNSRAISAHFQETGFKNLTRLVPSGNCRRIYISLTGRASPVHLGTVSFATIDGLRQLAIPPPAVPLPGECARQISSLVHAYCLLISKPFDTNSTTLWNDIINYCRATASLSTWVSLASKIQASEMGVQIEFQGFRRVTFELPPLDSLNTNAISNTLNLREWAFQEASPDRLLAISQVVSLYDRDDPFLHTVDIKASAEVVYIGLRSDAVAEVIKSSRDAYNQANETVRQGLKSSQDLIKSSMERFLAGLVAVGAVTIANASRVISNDASRLLMLFIAGFFLVLTIVALFVEGPLLSLQIKNLDHDIRQSASLLTEQQIASVANSVSVRATRKRIVTVRVAIPAIYAMLALAIVIWAYP